MVRILSRSVVAGKAEFNGSFINQIQWEVLNVRGFWGGNSELRLIAKTVSERKVRFVGIVTSKINDKFS